MKVRANKDTEFLSSNSKEVFNLDFDECNKLSSVEKDLLIETYMQPALEDKAAKQEAIKLATAASNKGEIVFRQIANKKNVSIEKISSVFRQAIDKSETALYNVARIVMERVEKELTYVSVASSLNKELFSSGEKDYIYAISILCEVLLRKNIIWFLKIGGYPPTPKQIDMINDYFSKCETEERITANTKSMVEESINPLNTMIGGNKDSIDALKVEVEKLVNAIQVLDIRRQQLSAELSSRINKIEKKIEDEMTRKNSNEALESIIADLDKKTTGQYSELANKMVDIELIKTIINDSINSIETKLSSLSHNTDNLANSLTNMILQNKNRLIADKNDLDELKTTVSVIEQRIEKINNTNIYAIDKSNSTIYIEKGTKLSGKLEKCDSIDFFTDLLKDNLKKYSSISAEYIISIMLSDTIPLFCGFNAREVATIVSASLCGEKPYIISIPNDFNNIEYIIDICKNTDTGVILIEDLLSSMNERLIFSLLRAYRRNRIEFRAKGIKVPYIFMSCESSEDFKILPLSIFNHVTIVQCPEHINSIDYNDLDLGDAEKVLRSNLLSTNSKENIKFKIKISNSSLPDIYYQIKSNIIGNFNNGVTTLINNEIRYILSDEEVKVFQNE